MPPDVQVSDANFTPDGEAIRFGLAAIKNVGGNAMESIIAARARVGGEGSTLRVAAGSSARRWIWALMNKRVLESLIKAGAMDSFGRTVAAHGRGRQRDGAGAEGAARCSCGTAWALRNVRRRRPAASRSGGFAAQRAGLGRRTSVCRHEKEVLGFFVSGHPHGQVPRKSCAT